MMHNTAYGFWSSAISAEMVAQNSEACSQLKVHKNTVYYCEQRAAEKGRVTILSCDNQGLISECLPKEYSARSRVHEYGGGDFAVGDTGMYFVNDADQAIYCISNKNVLRITELNNHSRYADLQLSPDENYLVCVRERHENSVINDLICIDLASLHIEILVSGADFYMSPVFCENSKKNSLVAMEFTTNALGRNRIVFCGFHRRTSEKSAENSGGRQRIYLSAQFP